MKQLIPFAFLFVTLQTSAQCLLREVPLQQRTTQSALIIEGRVIAKQSFWNDGRTMIYTRNTIEVTKLFKGVLSTASIDLFTEGGTVGMAMIKAEPSLEIATGDIGVFFCQGINRTITAALQNTTLPQYTAYASAQGFIRYDVNEHTAADPFKKYTNVETDLYRSLSPSGTFRQLKAFTLGQPGSAVSQRTTDVSGFSPATIAAGTGAVLTINGSGFGATQGTGVVAFRNANNGGSGYINPLPSQYVSWSDNQIMVQVPSGAGTGTFQVIQGASTFTGATPLAISYSNINANYDPGTGVQAYVTRHINRNGTGGYVWQMSTGFDANAAAKASFTRAFNTWRCNTGVNWTIGAVTAVNGVNGDGVNVICFDDAAPLAAGTLGVCYSYFSGCSSGGTIYWWINELDIIFDEGSNISPRTWQYGTALPATSQYDFETVAVHELGHGHQQAHVISAGAIMHYAIANGASNRSLSANDLAGGNTVQARSLAGTPCAAAMTAYGSCSTLPITVTSLNAYSKSAGVQVEWQNLSETEVSRYEVEKSTDGTVFSKAEAILPKRNNGTLAAYGWFDAQAKEGLHFYRIRSVGYATEKYTAVVRVQLSKSAATFIAYPNPVRGGKLMLELNGVDAGVYRLQVLNAAGQEVVSNVLTHTAGNGVQMLNLTTLAPGVYKLRVQGRNLQQQQTILISR